MIHINVQVADLISALKTNREAHVVEYKEAIVEYWVQVQAEFDTQVATAQSNITTKNNPEGFGVHVFLTIPEDREKNYTNQIVMYEHTLKAGQEVIELTDQQFNEIVNDEFTWALSAKMLNSTYSNNNMSN